MRELLLTHGYFLFEDPKEQKIMKPYAPLGILYLCSHLRKVGFDVDVFDTTFARREDFFRYLRAEKPSVLGIYANLMTRGNVIETLGVAREAGWKTVVGGPEPGAYSIEYLQAGADFVVSGEGEITMEELLQALRCGERDLSKIAGLSWLNENGRMIEGVPRGQIANLDRQPACAGGDRYSALCGHLANPSRQWVRELHHGAGMSLSLQLVQPPGLRTIASPARPCSRCG
jgi:radical SAM superfamily enzyme YgiQ (UPF0313 family)